MDRCYFIDKETFEVYEKHPKVFSCDPMIAEAISRLNKLGYTTLASCEGHYEIKDYDISCSKENMVTSIYILFKEFYPFLDGPEGFNLEKGKGYFTLRHILKYYDAFGNYRHRLEFEQEKEKYCKILTDWAKKLPERER